MIKGDSKEYELIEKAIHHYSPDSNYILSLEIGDREGLSSKIIMDTFNNLHPNNLISYGIDPYGNFKYITLR
jgi:hypothetical protein